jgi:hypothetical protein
VSLEKPSAYIYLAQQTSDPNNQRKTIHSGGRDPSRHPFRVGIFPESSPQRGTGLTTRKSRRPPPPSDLARWRDSWSLRGPTTCRGRQLSRAQSRGRGRRMDGHAAARKPVGAARSRARQGTTCSEWMSSSSGLPSASSKIRPWPRGGGWGVDPAVARALGASDSPRWPPRLPCSSSAHIVWPSAQRWRSSWPAEVSMRGRRETGR